jgi:hypothetical protein
VDFFEFGRIFRGVKRREKPGFAGFRFAPFFALCAKNASRPFNPLRAPEAARFAGKKILHPSIPHPSLLIPRFLT